MIICIGDSHALFFSGGDRTKNWQKERRFPNWCKNNVPLFKAMIVGHATAYNLCTNGSASKGRENLFSVLKDISKGSTVLLCFGEIDCRAHLLKEAEKLKRPIKEIVDVCINRYFSTVLEVRNLGFKVILWEVTPDAIFDDQVSNELTTYGKWEDRLEIVKLFNKRLVKLAEVNGINTLSINDRLIKDGKTNPENYTDGVHLKQTLMPLVLERAGRLLI